MKKLWRSQQGVTLVEVLVGVGIMTIIMTFIGSAIFLALGTEKQIVDDGRAILELRRSFSWFAEDVKMSRSTDLVDGGSAASSVTLTWTDEFGGAGVAHTSSYNLVGDRLVRNYDGNAHTVAQGVVSVGFLLSGRTVTAELEVDAKPDTIRTLSVEAVMRPAP